MEGVSNKPGRRETSMGGMIGAMIVLVACILGYVAFRETFRETPDVRPEHIEWELAANAAIDDGHPIVSPEVPEDWLVTTFRFEPTDPIVWGLGMYTHQGEFAGLRQEDAPVDELVERYVGEDAEQGDPVTITGEFAGEWDTWTDDRKDTGLVLMRDGYVYIVYGSAPKDQLVDIASSLRTGRVDTSEE